MSHDTSSLSSTLNLKETNYTKSIKESVYLVPITSEEVSYTINSLKSSNYCGFDDMSSKVIKRCYSEIISPLTYFISLSERREFPYSKKKSAGTSCI